MATYGDNDAMDSWTPQRKYTVHGVALELGLSALQRL